MAAAKKGNADQFGYGDRVSHSSWLPSTYSKAMKKENKNGPVKQDPPFQTSSSIQIFLDVPQMRREHVIFTSEKIGKTLNVYGILQAFNEFVGDFRTL